jgi:hypothetical protein
MPPDCFTRISVLSVNPGDLPVEQPINLRTAEALGLNAPDKLLTRADEMIE